MQEMPLVSIVTPSYNQAEFIEQTMLSVFGQDYPNIEYIVIDGASTDGSREIIESYADRLAFWTSEKDKGQADGINKGFRKAKGEIVAWLNSDDLYTPGAISEAVACFKAHPEASFVYSDVESIDAKGRGFNLMRYGNWGLSDLMQFKIIGQPGVFINAACLKKAGLLDSRYHYLLDHQLWLRLARLAAPVYAQGKVWAKARIHEGAKNVADAEKFGPEAFRLAHWMGNTESFYPESARYYRKILGGAYRLNAHYLVDAERPGEALKMYRQSFRLDPIPVIKVWKRVLLAMLSSGGLPFMRKLAEKMRNTGYRMRHQKG